MLVAVVLSNAYKGDNITKLAAPLKPILPETFRQLLDMNYTVYTKVDYDTEIRLYENQNFTKSKDRCNAQYFLDRNEFMEGALDFGEDISEEIGEIVRRGEFQQLIRDKKQFDHNIEAEKNWLILNTSLY